MFQYLLIGKETIHSSVTNIQTISTSCPLECSLNGVCERNSSCVCDPGWIGADCSRLNLGPAPPGGALGVGPTPFSSPSRWGGNALLDPETKLWHLFSTEIPGVGCGLHDWQGGSTVIHSTASNVLGPFTRRDLALPQDAHNPQAIRMPDGKWYIFHIGTAEGKGNLPVCDESHDSSGFPPWPAVSTATASCPPAPKGFNLSAGACISDIPCNLSHCNCGAELLSGPCEPHDVASCAQWGYGNCTATVGCSSFALRVNDNCSTVMRWALHAKGSPVPNQDWAAYVGPPVPGPPPPKPGSSLHVADSPSGPWTPVIPPPPRCNNPAPALHPNGTLFLACTWFMMSAPSPLGPWSSPIPIKSVGARPLGAWEDPYLWFDARGNFHILAHVYKGTDGDIVSGHAFSKDGFNWVFSSTQPYSSERLMAVHSFEGVGRKDGRKEGGNEGEKVGRKEGREGVSDREGGLRYATLERPKLVWNGSRPVALTNGASTYWGSATNQSAPCASCLRGACVMCKVSCKARGLDEDLDWTITLIRPILS